jgi:signal transduction histidine kinase
MIPPSTPATDDDSLVLNALWGALRVFRVLALVYALWSIWVRRADMARLDLALGVIGVLAVWTAYMYATRRRDLGVHLVEMVLASAAVMSTRWFDTPLSATTGDTTIPGVWQNVPVVAIALILGWRGGLIASLVITAVMIAQVGQFDSEPLSNAGLIVMLGTCLGFGADVARTEQAELRRVLAKQAEVAERDRLARVVHDGVLQALAFIHRRGRDIGGESARLGMIAAEQELRLRALVIGMPLPELEVAIAGPVDLRRALDAAVTDTATVVASADPVELDSAKAQEVVAAVEAALDNVRKHAGPQAHAWVLVDDLGADVVVTVRDDGPGVSQERIAEAARNGRLGVSSSIKGRIEDLGGRARYLTSPGGGTTVEMWIPKGGAATS